MTSSLRYSILHHPQIYTWQHLNLVEEHFPKKEAVQCQWCDITVTSIESYIHWHRSQVHHGQSIGETALDRRFGGRKNWRFIAQKNEFESVAMKRLERDFSKYSHF